MDNTIAEGIKYMQKIHNYKLEYKIEHRFRIFGQSAIIQRLINTTTIP
jgi:hypothetical protein